MVSQPEIERFIAATFRSVWALELLVLLREHGARMGHEEMVAGLRGSDTIVVQSLAGLAVAGLVVVDDDRGATYRPALSELDELVAETQHYYARSPDAVRRIIAAGWNPGLTAFADAFRFKKDGP